jgi:hypothetical protein
MRLWLKRSGHNKLILEKKKSLVKGNERDREAAQRTDSLAGTRWHRLTGCDDSNTVAAGFI